MPAADSQSVVGVAFGGSTNLTSQEVTNEISLLSGTGSMVLIATAEGFDPVPVANHSMLTYTTFTNPDPRIVVYGGQTATGQVVAQAFRIVNGTYVIHRAVRVPFASAHARPSPPFARDTVSAVRAFP